MYIGQDGYVLPASQILPNCEEIVDGMFALYNEARLLGVFRGGPPYNTNRK